MFRRASHHTVDQKSHSVDVHCKFLYIPIHFILRFVLIRTTRKLRSGIERSKLFGIVLSETVLHEMILDEDEFEVTPFLNQEYWSRTEHPFFPYQEGWLLGSCMPVDWLNMLNVCGWSGRTFGVPFDIVTFLPMKSQKLQYKVPRENTLSFFIRTFNNNNSI